jgi:hypothetical protein
MLVQSTVHETPVQSISSLVHLTTRGSGSAVADISTSNSIVDNMNHQRQPNLRGGGGAFDIPLLDSHQAKAAASILKGDRDSSSQQTNLAGMHDLSSSLHATRTSYIEAPSNLDRKNILVASWIYLDDLGSSDNDMRTIFANKASGCGHNQDQYGLSLYVNAWHSNDKRLYAEYGGKSSGCYKFGSGSVMISSQRWYHVALVFSGDHGRIFIDGEEVGRSNDGSELHEVQSKRPLLVGQYEPGTYPLIGNLSHVVIIEDPPAEEIDLKRLVQRVKDLEQIEMLPGLVAHYPLIEAAHREAIAHDYSLHKYDGKYHFPVSGVEVSGVKIPLIDGTNGQLPSAADLQKSDELGRERCQKIKASMKWVWKSYKQYAWGADELKPISHRGDNNWGGMGVTLVDSLDTLWLMGLKEEFEDAKRWIQQSLSFSHAGTISVFETTIRELGGLLSAYDLSGDSIFLEKAKELGNLLLPAFRTPTGIPYAMINLNGHSGVHGWAGSSAILSELGSLQLEFRYLSYKTKQLDFEAQSMRAMQLMHKKHPAHGLYPIKVNMHDGNFVENSVTFGALGDSFYEYLLKVWLQGGKKENWLRDMYDDAVNGVIEVLLQASDPSGLAFLGDWNGYTITRKMDHLACFMAATLALGSIHDPRGKDSARAKRDMAVAKALTYTCREMYHRMESGISAEYVEFPHGQDIAVPGHVGFYILRPEVAEALFYLHQLTGDPIYREWSWEIWEAIDRHCKTDVAYASLRSVHNPAQGVDDRMESFFLAETIKYLYLIQDPDKPIDLTEYVFNTEAHPMRIFDSSHTPISA